MPTEYTAEISKLRLPEQDDLKNESEGCSANPTTLKSIGREIGQQVRITRSNVPNFVAVYTVKQPNPDSDLGDPELASVVRTGQTGRERLGTPEEMGAIVQAKVVDDAPASRAFRFFELADGDEKRAYLIAIAPHGGEIEPHTDKQVQQVITELKAASVPASFWLCKGFGDRDKGAFDRWHITSEDIQPACFPLLEPLASRTFCYGIAFHGFDRTDDDADIYIGGGASLPLKRAVEKALIDLNLPIEVKISTCNDKPKFQGFSPENIINRLASRGIQLEQSREARQKFGQQVAVAVAKVFASRRRIRFGNFGQNIEARRAQAKIEFVQSLRNDLAAGPLNIERAIAKHRAWRARDDAMTAKIQAAEELQTFIEEHVEEGETTQVHSDLLAKTSSQREKRRRLRNRAES
jgi:phage replication-related protein YjqB (UPF0714/DUF867 family)